LGGNIIERHCTSGGQPDAFDKRQLMMVSRAPQQGAVDIKES